MNDLISGQVDVPDTNVGDMISRQAAIDALWKVKDERDSVYYTSAIHTAVETLEQLPSAQPETPPYVAEIECEYKKWVSIPRINKPLAKALYEVWKKHDREDVSRNG